METLGDPRLADRYWLIGWSNWEKDRVQKSLVLSGKHGLPTPVFNSPYFSLFEMSCRSIHARGVQVTHREMLDVHFQEGIKIMPYSPLGGFSILDMNEPRWENARKAARKKYDAGNPYWKNVFCAIFTDTNQKRYERVVEFTEWFNK